MSAPIRRLALCTNGAPQARPAVDFGIWLGERLGADITVLGVLEPGGSPSAVQEELDRAETRLGASGLSAHRETITGRAETAIASLPGDDGTLLVVGPFGRPVLLRWLRGRSLRRLMAATSHPILYVPQPKARVERILLCLGGLPIGLPAEELALDLGRRLAARVTLLHVVEPIGYDYPIARELQGHPDSLLESDTPQARMLSSALQAARQIDPTADLLVRQGSIVNQILTELQRQPYDLVALGSPGSGRSLRHLYAPNVTAEVAELGGVPVLVGGESPASAAEPIQESSRKRTESQENG